MNLINKIANRKSVFFYAVCILLTIGGFLAEMLKGNKTIFGLIILLLVCVAPLITAIVMYKKNPGKRMIKTFVGIAFAIGYSYILLTFSRFSVYSLVLVMLPILTLNTSRKNIFTFAVVVFLANVARIVLEYKGVFGGDFDLMEHFIQLSTVVLVFTCSIGTNKVSSMYNNLQLDVLNEEKANQQKAINTTNSLINSVRGYSHSLGENVDNLTTHSKDVSELTNTTNERAIYGSAVVGKISENGESVSESSVKVGKSIEELQVGVDRINETISIIYKISRQINLLSLNAAVESARSGEAGLGFAVVADEIKSLANQTAESTKRIDEIISELNDDVYNSVEAMTALDEANQEQNKLIEDVAKTYDDIKNMMGVVAGRVDTMNNMITTVSDSNKTMIDSMEE